MYNDVRPLEKHRIPLSVDIQSLLDVAMSDLSDQVQMYLQQAGVSQEGVFDGLHTQQQQL